MNGSGLKWELMRFGAVCCEETSSDVMFDQR